MGAAGAKELLLSMAGKFEVSQIYNLLRPAYPKVFWRYSVHDSAVYPKHRFIGHLAVQMRLPTVDSLVQRGFSWINRCALCEAAQETHQHLFFECTWSAALWTRIQSFFSFATHSNELASVLAWFHSHNRGSSWIKKRKRSALLSVIYQIWQERNHRIFRSQDRSIDVVSQLVISQVTLRMSFCSLGLDEATILRHMY
ncbi:uncharacterized protein LOC141640519 [Silene latifolia]|uniref:uncharacterized protein LOC141640519 n=1 Tax=Silene latifolia TaxID=37657 RepID=UPI003D78388A